MMGSGEQGGAAVTAAQRRPSDVRPAGERERPVRWAITVTVALLLIAVAVTVAGGLVGRADEGTPGGNRAPSDSSQRDAVDQGLAAAGTPFAPVASLSVDAATPEPPPAVAVSFVDETLLVMEGRPRSAAFEFAGNPGPALLRLSMDTGDGSEPPPAARVVAWVTLDGEEIAGPAELGGPTEETEVPIELHAGAIRLDVRLAGVPSSPLHIEVVQELDRVVASDTVWGGTVAVNDHVNVLPGKTLTIEPGTTVAFSHYRGYQQPDRRLGLTVQGGIVADGDADAPIVFTSDAPDPRNGDWSMLRLETPTAPALFDHVVFEFAQQGLNVWQGDVTISHAVFRWNNWEGLYLESESDVSIDHCAIYENGYNGLAAEQFNVIDMEYCEVSRNGTNGIHIDASAAEIRSSLVHDNLANGLSVDDNGSLTVLGVASTDNGDHGIGLGEGDNTVVVGNVVLSGNTEGEIGGPYTEVSTTHEIPDAIDLGFVPDNSQALGYIPGDPDLDEYQYIYPDDETRTIVRKIGEGLGLTWSLAWDGQHLWTSTVWGTIYELDPETGEMLATLQAPGPQPWGMTFDGTDLWVVDFAEQRISRLDPVTGAELATFPTPDPVGGCKGVTWDGTHLYVMGWTSPTIYQMTRSGELVDTIDLAEGGGGIAWDGSHFWVPGGPGILRYDTSGQATGWIYAASEGTWDLTWDGTYLWATQRTNENWQDAKIFALEVWPQPFE
jgi:hypothetical protein